MKGAERRTATSARNRAAGVSTAAPALVLALLLPACGARQPGPEPAPGGEALSILIAAAADTHARLRATPVVLDTTGMQTEHAAAVAARLGVRAVRRNEVLNCVPPICRLEGAAAMMWLAPPARMSAEEAWVQVIVWTEVDSPRGAAFASQRVVLRRQGGGEWVVHSRKPGPVS
jgi:hypothetical protein